MEEPRRRVALVTGTSRGLGHGIVRLLVEAGYRVEGCSRSPSAYEAEAYRHTVLHVQDEVAVRSWVRGAKRAHGHIDLLVHGAAAIPRPALLSLATVAEARDAWETNILGSFIVLRETAKAMVAQQHGSIVTLSSIAVSLHDAGTAIYAASKAALEEMTKVLAREVGPYGVTCNILSPAVFNSESLDVLTGKTIDETLGRLAIPRAVSVEEVFGTIEFLSSPAATGITGQTLHYGWIG
jgi:3-oxoacyl-[acyl-carrier protein] reductase